MPTLAGDVVIERADAAASRYSVWRVMLDGEQAPNRLAYLSTFTACSTAMSLARLMVRESRGGAIYFVELDTRTWSQLAD